MHLIVWTNNSFWLKYNRELWQIFFPQIKHSIAFFRVFPQIMHFLFIVFSIKLKMLLYNWIKLNFFSKFKSCDKILYNVSFELIIFGNWLKISNILILFSGNNCYKSSIFIIDNISFKLNWLKELFIISSFLFY